MLENTTNPKSNFSNNQIVHCPCCGSWSVIKRGKAYTQLRAYWSQRYLCRACRHRFSDNSKHASGTDFKYESKPLQPIDWSSFNAAQINEKLMFLDLVNELLDLVVVELVQRTGRPSSSARDMLFCMLLKTFAKISSRRLISDLQIARDMGYIGKVPCYSTLMLYFNDKRLQRLLQELITLSALPVKDVEEQFSVDSSGFSTSKFGRWFDHKFNIETERRIYRKAHITIGTKTNIVTSVIITEQNAGDSPQFESLVRKTALHFNVKEVSADKAYSSRKNCELVAGLGAIPYIPFKSSATGKAHGSRVWRTMYEYSKNFPQEFLERYHKRSNIESTFNMIKQKFDDCLMTKNFTANTNEILCKILCHNLCCLISAYFELGIKASFCTQTPEIGKISIKA